jgi:hypothetical protein
MAMNHVSEKIVPTLIEKTHAAGAAFERLAVAEMIDAVVARSH